MCAFSFDLQCVSSFESLSLPPAFHSNQHQRLLDVNHFGKARSIIFLSPPAYTVAVGDLIFFGIYCENVYFKNNKRSRFYFSELFANCIWNV